MSTPNYGGQPGPNGQFQGQVPQQGAYNPQYQGQAPAPGPNGQFQGQAPQPGPNGQFQGQVPAPGPNGQFQGQVPAPGEKKSRGKMAAIISVIVVAVLVVVGGGAFALSRLGGGGYKSPDALAQGIDSAFAKNSLVSLAGAASPEELNAATAWQKDYKHNGGTDWSKLMDLKALKDYVDQIDIKKSEMEYTVDTKSDQVALITITKWEGDVEIKPELADKIREHYKEAKGSDLTANESQAFDKMKQEIQNNPVSSGNVLKNFPNNKLTLVSVKEDGKWYLSGYMTVAEQFLGTGSAQPNYSANFTDVKGASSPEEAVSGMVDALRNGASIGSEDVYRYLDLPERRVAAVYGGGASSSGYSASGRGGSGVQVTWGLNSTKVSGGAIVNPGTTSITMGEYKVEFNGDSLTVSYPDIDVRTFRTTTKTMTTKYTEGLVNPERLGVFTVEDGSGWHVSLVRTIGNLNLLAASDDAVNQAIDGLWSSTGSHDVDVSKDEMRDLALNNKPVGALLVIGWNFAKNAQ